MYIFECDGCGVKCQGEMRWAIGFISKPFGWIEYTDGRHACSQSCNEKIHDGIEAARRFVGGKADGR